MEKAFEKLQQYKIIPVIKLNSAKNALPLAEALCAGGLPVAEVTFRTDAAEESIRQIAAAFPQVALGAGTVTNVEQVKRAVGAGASYIVTPGFSAAVAAYCTQNRIPVTLGVCTPTEIMQLMEYGLTVAKFFPAEQFGGVKTMQALCAPFPDLRFIPTGGIGLANILEYLSFKKVIACGGSWMVKDAYIENGDYDTVTRLTKEAVVLAAACK